MIRTKCAATSSAMPLEQDSERNIGQSRNLFICIGIEFQKTPQFKYGEEERIC